MSSVPPVMPPFNPKTANMDELLQQLVRLDFDEANIGIMKRQLLEELSARLTALAAAEQRAVPGATVAPVEEAIASMSTVSA